MPLYEYLCEKCGSKFELIEKFSAVPKTEHDGCGGAVHRLLSAPALMFKGSGFYVNDYAKSGATPKGESKKAGDGSKSSSSDSESKSSESKSSDSKSSEPATKTPAPTPSTSSSSSSSSDSATKN